MGEINIPACFPLPGMTTDVRPFGSGHIHDTYSVFLDGRVEPQYLLQRINSKVFRNISGMMRNIVRVTQHLRFTLDNQDDEVFRTLELVRTTDGEEFLTDKDGEKWRMYHFLHGLNSYDILPNHKFVKECGKGYGKFMYLLKDLPANDLVQTIPRFHEIEYRLSQLEDARAGSAVETNGLYDMVEELAETMISLDSVQVPIRITHNDTKSNNILFDQQGNAACVVDLDTVMPGKIWYDTGDSLRSILSVRSEDDDSETIEIQSTFYEAFLEGFVRETCTMMTDEEWTCIPLSGAYMAFIMGVRFLTDHLSGDVYYKTTFRGQNLKRAGNQLNLAHKLWGMEEEFRKKLEKIHSEIQRK